MSIQKLIHRSVLLLLTLTLALVAFGFASGKITHVSLEIHHVSAPDIYLHVDGESPSGSASTRPNKKHAR